MHRTELVDYGIVISGEMTLILGKGETLLREGDVVIQRGMNHAWVQAVLYALPDAIHPRRRPF